MENSFKKLMILITGIASSLGSYMFSGAGIAAATLGSFTAITVFAVEKKNTSKYDDKKKVKKPTKKTNRQTEKKVLRSKIATKKKELKNHRNELRKLKRSGKGSTPQAAQHKTMIQDLDDMISDLKRKLENL